MGLGHLLATVAAVVGTAVAPAADGPPLQASDPGAAAVLTAPTIQDGDLDFTVRRVSGNDRYETAAAVSRRFVDVGTPVAYVVNGASWTDAAVAGPAAGRTGGPVLYVKRDSVPATTRTELSRLRPGRIVIVGSTGNVSSAVRTTLAGYTTGTVSRLTATDRYTRSAVVSRAAFSSGASIAYVSAGADDYWANSVTGGAAAVVQGAPLLMTARDSLPAAVRAELVRLDPDRIMLIGGTGGVSSAVATQLGQVAATERVSGSNRFTTGLAVSRRVFGTDRPAVTIASGDSSPTAMTVAPVTATTRGPVLLGRQDSFGVSSRQELDRLAPGTAYVVGGTSTLSIEVPKAAQRTRGVCWSGPDYTTGTKQVLSAVSGTDSRKIAFTLDMGGRLEGATDIVDFLIANQVCTTFFPTSIMADTAEGRQVMSRIAAHPELFEIGNHTVHHCDLVNGGGGSPTAAPCDRSMTSSFIRSELTGAETVLRGLTGLSTKPYWRPPYGSHNTSVRDNAAAVGYPVVMMWNRDTIDWHPDTTTAQIVSRTTSPLPPSGSIVLAHLGGYHTGAALPQIVQILRDNGYTLTTVSDMRDG
jgi:peptidoglycan-N-acetylglucosamine deacetylase